jgi:hypothetical protein
VPEWRIQRPSSLQHALRRQDVPEWKIPVLIDSGGIQVLRGNTQLQLNGPRTHLKQFDLVRLLDPLPATATKALQQAVNTNARDYALVPGQTKYDKAMARLLDTRPETIRIKDPTYFDLARFVTRLDQSVEATHPIRNLLPASHANAEGYLWLRVGSTVDRITFGALVKLVTSKAIVINDQMLEPRPVDAKTGKPVPTRFIIRGCRIGHQDKFMRKLKEALGNKAPVAAPVHYHVATPIKKPLGHIEYLGYAFELASPTRFKDRAALVAAMAGKAFPRIDNSTVPAKVWSSKSWIPSNPHKITDEKKQEGEQPLQTEVTSPIDGRKTKLPRHYRYKIRKLLDQDNRVEVPGQSTKLADRTKAAREQLVKLQFFEEQTGFPVYERFGFKSIDEFMAGWEWRFKPKTKSKFVTYNAYRHEYRVVDPIVELEKGKAVKPGELILNFNPTRPGRRSKPLETLTPDDLRLYKLV